MARGGGTAAERAPATRRCAGGAPARTRRGGPGWTRPGAPPPAWAPAAAAHRARRAPPEAAAPAAAGSPRGASATAAAARQRGAASVSTPDWSIQVFEQFPPEHIIPVLLCWQFRFIFRKEKADRHNPVNTTRHWPREGQCSSQRRKCHSCHCSNRITVRSVADGRLPTLATGSSFGQGGARCTGQTQCRTWC